MGKKYAILILVLIMAPCILLAETLPADLTGTPDVEVPGLPVISSEPEMPDINETPSNNEPALPADTPVAAQAVATAVVTAAPAAVTATAAPANVTETAQATPSTDDAKLRFQKGKNFFKAKDYKNALLELQAADLLYPKKKAPETLKEMIAASKTEIKKSEKKTAALLSAGDRLFSAGRYKEAASEWKKILKFDGNNAEAQSKISACETALKNQVDALLTEAGNYAQSSLIVEAVTSIRKIQELDPENAKAAALYSSLAAAIQAETKKLESEGIEKYTSWKYDEAIICWEKALILDPGNEELQSKVDKTKKKMKNIGNMSDEKKK